MKKNLVVIGYGGMGGWHTEHASKSDVVNLLGVHDILPERNALARARGIHAYERLEDVLADNAVQLVTIATPNDVHRDLVIQALDAGKNVICEKPVALSTEDLRAMDAAAKRNNRFFTVHQNRRWDVDFLAMKQIKESGEIGRVFNIESRIHGSRGIPSDWRGLKEYGGGMLFDWGVHLIDQVLQLFPQRLDRLYCQFSHITNADVDDGFHLSLMFEDGCTARVEVGTYNFIPLPRFYMQGMDGTAMIANWQEKTRVVECTHWHESEVLPVQTAAGLTKTMAPRDDVTTRTYEVERPGSDVHDFYRNVCRAIDGREAQLVTVEQALYTLRTIEVAFDSAASGQVLPFHS